MLPRVARGLEAVTIALAFMMATACVDGPVATVRLATTTSVESSGLLSAILPAFQRQKDITVEVLPVGSGRALQLLERGDVALALTHDPRAEEHALARGMIRNYRKVMFNDFIIVGPLQDVAHVTQASDAVDAMRRIATADAVFVSRGDASGTYSREQELWEQAMHRPSHHRLLETGQGMSPTLRVASERRGYTLTDRATFEQFQAELQLVTLFEGGAELLNTYAIFVRSSLTRAEREAAVALVDWLADGAGRHLVAGYRVNGRVAFSVWPAGVPRDRPDALPDAH